MITVVAALIKKDNQILITKRSTGNKDVIGKWEFPGGKVQENESEKEAIIREIKEELEINIKANKLVCNSIYEYPGKTIDLRLYDCTYINGQIILTQLILELSPFCQLIQSNTDGLVVKYKEADYDKIVEIVKDFGSRFELTFDIDIIIKIAQRDVNNYAIMYENGKIEAKGRFSKFDNGDFYALTHCFDTGAQFG
jgi:mutator protein MutT